MTGSKAAFSELNDDMIGTVKFGDGSKVVISRDVVFDEKAARDWDSLGMGEASSFTSTFIVKHMVIHGGGTPFARPGGQDRRHSSPPEGLVS